MKPVPTASIPAGPEEGQSVEAPAAELSARVAHLLYVTDEGPGIHRLRSGKGFRYIGLDGKPLRAPAELARIRALALPPAWRDVWICPQANGHLQATGRDARNRKQYRYHPRWCKVRGEAKYERVLAFARALPSLRARLDQDLALPGLPRNKVVAVVVRLLEVTLIRVGNEEYARQNSSYGLTTLRNRHAQVEGGTVRFRFRGKSGIRHSIEIDDHRLARLVRRCQELPGQELFQFRGEDGEYHAIGSADVNSYLHEVMGEEFTAKDFRTWAGTLFLAEALQACGPFDTEASGRKNIQAAIKAVAARLGNTPAVCRKCYAHPGVFAAYLEGSLNGAPARAARKVAGLTAEEAAIVALLEGRQKPGP